VNKHVDKKLKI